MNTPKLTIVLADIFGRTEAVETFCKHLDCATKICDPYDGRRMNFNVEAQAYQHFSQFVGLERYQQLIDKELSQFKEPVRVIGFSVGAAALWRLSESKHLHHVKQGVCFYGSQIRNALEIVPNFKVDLILPKMEKHFSVKQMIEQLNVNHYHRRSLVTIEQVGYLHGFMNQLSTNFDMSGYQLFIDRLNNLSSG